MSGYAKISLLIEFFSQLKKQIVQIYCSFPVYSCNKVREQNTFCDIRARLSVYSKTKQNKTKISASGAIFLNF